MDEDDVRSRDARPPPDGLPGEVPVVDDHLEIQFRDVATGAARATLVTRHSPLLLLEHAERVREQGRQDTAIGQRPVGADGEHGVPLELLDLERRCEPTHHRFQEDAGDLRAVLQLGPNNERGEPGDVGQDEKACLGPDVVAHTPASLPATLETPDGRPRERPSNRRLLREPRWRGGHRVTPKYTKSLVPHNRWRTQKPCSAIFDPLASVSPGVVALPRK